jgi:2,4-dienoyl-CoA reductase-like NADH-dependent reductase (Old Yellow Enzyme family)
MSALFTPTTLRSLHIPNRIFISPMCQYSAERGEATDWHMIHLGSLALSGAGMLFIEATAVEPDGRITPGDLGLWDDATENALRPVMAAIRKYSQIPVTMQLAHAGRKASSHTPWEGGQLISVADGGWMTHAPSAIPHKPDETPPLALDTAGLLRVKEAFAASARRAAKLGIDGLELHCAHGYLLHQFLSPLSNQRTDEYGGSRENRMRYPLEVFDAVRAAFPDDKPVGVRVSATDWVEGGWNIEDTIAFADELKQRGVDWVDASSGGVSPMQQIPLEPGYQVPFAKAVKEATGVTTVAVGLITEAKHAEEIVASGQADYVAIARAALYDARWPWHAAAELGASVQAPPQYWRSQPREQKHLFGDITIGQR